MLETSDSFYAQLLVFIPFYPETITPCETRIIIQISRIGIAPRYVACAYLSVKAYPAGYAVGTCQKISVAAGPSMAILQVSIYQKISLQPRYPFFFLRHVSPVAGRGVTKTRTYNHAVYREE